MIPKIFLIAVISSIALSINAAPTFHKRQDFNSGVSAVTGKDVVQGFGNRFAEFVPKNFRGPAAVASGVGAATDLFGSAASAAAHRLGAYFDTIKQGAQVATAGQEVGADPAEIALPLRTVGRAQSLSGIAATGALANQRELYPLSEDFEGRYREIIADEAIPTRLTTKDFGAGAKEAARKFGTYFKDNFRVVIADTSKDIAQKTAEGR